MLLCWQYQRLYLLEWFFRFIAIVLDLLFPLIVAYSSWRAWFPLDYYSWLAEGKGRKRTTALLVFGEVMLVNGYLSLHTLLGVRTIRFEEFEKETIALRNHRLIMEIRHLRYMDDCYWHFDYIALHGSLATDSLARVVTKTYGYKVILR